MPARAFPPSPYSARPNIFTKTRVLFLALSISASFVIVFSVFYFLYHLWHSLIPRAKTIPFDSSTPLKLQRFSYKELKHATNGFDASNVIGKGGSGTVYRGVLRDGKLIAVKRLDTVSLQTDQEFQNEIQILGGLRSPFLVTLLGYCVEKNDKVLVYEYMPNRSLQESIFREGCSILSWDRRFQIILDVAKALEFLHLGCDPPVVHGDIKPSNVLLDAENHGKLSDFGLSRIKVEGEFGLDLFSQDIGKSPELWKSQDLSGNLTVETPPIGTPAETANDVDFALALQASSSSKNGRTCYNVKTLNLNSLNYNVNIASECEIRLYSAKGKEVSVSCNGGDDRNSKLVSYDDELSSIEHSKELHVTCTSSMDEDVANAKQWGKDWWWKQDGTGELCSKDYVMEWIGSQISPSKPDPDWDEEKKNTNEFTDFDNSTMADKQHNATMADKQDNAGSPQVQGCSLEDDIKGIENNESTVKKDGKKKQRKMKEWWKEEHLFELTKKGSKLKNIKRLKRRLRLPHFDIGRRFCFRKRKNFTEQNPNEYDQNEELSFRRGLRKKNSKSINSDMCSGDLFSRELSSTASMRGTLCYVAPEYGGYGLLMEKADIYSLGVLVLVVVSGRRPLHVLASPMKLEKANLISWCRHLAQTGNILELVDERLRHDYNKEQASLCINLTLFCLQKMPEIRPDIRDIVKILESEMDLPPVPFEFSPSPPSRCYRKSRRKHKSASDSVL